MEWTTNYWHKPHTSFIYQILGFSIFLNPNFWAPEKPARSTWTTLYNRCTILGASNIENREIQVFVETYILISYSDYIFTQRKYHTRQWLQPTMHWLSGAIKRRFIVGNEHCSQNLQKFEPLIQDSPVFLRLADKVFFSVQKFATNLQMDYSNISL